MQARAPPAVSASRFEKTEAIPLRGNEDESRVLHPIEPEGRTAPTSEGDHPPTAKTRAARREKRADEASPCAAPRGPPPTFVGLGKLRKHGHRECDEQGGRGRTAAAEREAPRLRHFREIDKINISDWRQAA